MTLLEPDTRAPERPESEDRRPVWSVRVFAVCVALVTLAFLQDPGRVASDTKLDLTVNPWGFLGRALHLWDPEGFFGQLQNQAYGYLWPMGPFFGIGQAIGLPDWVIQRLWWSLILVTAFLGMYLLLRALRVGGNWPQILAGLAYALAVRPQSAIGAVSVEVWPMAVAPWVLLPLVRYARHGNVARGAALSALAVTMGGGVNAVAASAVLPLAVWWLITLEPGPRRRRLAIWWSGLTVLAILWWLLPLVVLGKYSPPFLDWIESAQFTTSITDPTSVLRGADHWLAYLGTASGWTAGWMLATYPLFIAATAVVAAAGVAGLAMRSLPHRTFLVGAAIAGLVIVTAGHVGVFSGFGSEQIQDFLDGAGAPLRNVHKFDLVLRIPLVIAFCHVLTRVWPQGRTPRWRVLVTGLLIGALALTWWPAATGQLTRERSYTSVADHWREASEWLNTQADPGRALIVPGASFGQYVWGRTQDEPLQAFGGYPWGVRDAVPLSSAGNIRMLDAVEARLASGQGSAGLAEYLQRMGVRYLVVRNDLATSALAPLPARVHQALDSSAGLDRVAFFGPVVDRTGGASVVFEEGLRVPYPAVEIYEVQADSEPPDPRVVLRRADNALEVDGGPEALLALADIGALGNRETVLAGDEQARGITPAAGVVTDTDRRREMFVGYTRDNESPTMTADQPYEQSRAVHDYRVVGESGSTVAVPRDVQFDASSSASDVDATWRQPRGAEPAAAMDGALDTFWRPGAINEEGSFWEVRYPQPVTLGDSVEISLLNRGGRNETTIPLEITTDNGTVSVDAADSARWQSVPVAAGPTSRVRVALADVFRPPLLGIREIRLPGEGVSELQLPSGEPGDAVLLTARPGDAGECITRDDTVLCSDALVRTSQDRTGLHRLVDLPSAITSEPRVLVAPRDTSTVADAVGAVAGTEVTSSSTRTATVGGSALSAFDRRLGTAWQAAPDDKEPWITITLPETREIRGVRLVNKQGLNASFPLEVQVEAGGRSVTGFTDSRGLLEFEPVTTDQVTIRVLSTNTVRSRSELGELVLPVGISEIGLIGADDLRRALPPDAVVSLPCGTGPDIRIDGRTVSTTAVSGRVEQFVNGETLPATVCESPVRIPAGQHRLAVVSSEAFRPVVAGFAPEELYGPTGRPDSPQVQQWGAAERVVTVPAAEDERVLEIAENYNEGWRAQVDGQELTPTRVDGWKQAFVIPAGTSGDVVVEYGPDSGYRWGLLAGLLAVLAVVFIAIRPPGMPSLPQTTSRQLPRLLTAIVVAGVLLVLGPWGLLAFGVAALLVRRLNLPAVAFAGVVVAAAVTPFAGVKPGPVALTLQGCALAVSLAAVAWATWSGADASSGRGSSAEPAAR